MIEYFTQEISITVLHYYNRHISLVLNNLQGRSLKNLQQTARNMAQPNRYDLTNLIEEV